MATSRFGLFVVLLLVGIANCATKPAPVFRDPEIAYLRLLFSTPGMCRRHVLDEVELKTKALQSFRTHANEVLPILCKGWSEGWSEYPWHEAKAQRVFVPPMDADLWQVVVCLDPRTAESLIISKFEELKGRPEGHAALDSLVSELYWNLHSKRWKELFLQLLADQPEWSYLFVCYCAQENDPDALPQARSLLRAKRAPWETIQCRAYIYQIEGDVKALKKMCIRYGKTTDVLVPLWSLVFMGRLDVVEELAGAPERMDAAFRVMRAAELWEKERNSPPCETRRAGSLTEMIALLRYTPPGPTR